MPANKKYLTASPWQRFAKVSAATLGALLVSVFLFTSLTYWLGDHKSVITTAVFALFPVWITLMILPFLFENGWKVWMYYAGIIILLLLTIYFGKLYVPIH